MGPYGSLCLGIGLGSLGDRMLETWPVWNNVWAKVWDTTAANGTPNGV